MFTFKSFRSHLVLTRDTCAIEGPITEWFILGPHIW
jgi:hypothetical protein